MHRGENGRWDLLSRVAIITAFSFSILVGGTLPLYPGAKLDQKFEREKVRNLKIETKQYTTSDSFDKVPAFYKNVAPLAPEWTINQAGHKRMAFCEKPDDKNSTTIDWSTEDSEDKDKTFIIVNSHK